MATLTNSSNTTSDGIKVVGYDMGTKVGHYMVLIDTSGNVISSLPVTNSAGTAIIGKVGIDQTTPGTTNAIVPKNSSGTELFTSGNPGQVTVNGSTVLDTQPVPVKSIKKITMETIINAVSVAASGYTEGTITPDTETEIWVAISINKFPWSVWGSSLFYALGDGVTNHVLYPNRINVSTAYSSLSTPCVSFYPKGGFPTFTTGSDPTSLAEAKQFNAHLVTSAKLRVINGSAETATVTLKIIRLWN